MNLGRPERRGLLEVYESRAKWLKDLFNSPELSPNCRRIPSFGQEAHEIIRLAVHLPSPSVAVGFRQRLHPERTGDHHSIILFLFTDPNSRPQSMQHANR